jgi:anti-anti-sigma regulatory factor
MVEHKDVLTLVGSNPKVEVSMKILGLDKIIKHEKEHAVINSVLTEV